MEQPTEKKIRGNLIIVKALNSHFFNFKIKLYERIYI